MKAPAKFARLMRAADARLQGVGLRSKPIRWCALNYLRRGEIVVVHRNGRKARGWSFSPQTKWRKVLMRLGQRGE